MGSKDIVWYNKFDGWMMADEELAKILENTERTEWGMSGVTGGPVCPQWVGTAYQTYKDNGGYAGMSPGEYIDRMADEQQQKPLHTF